MDQVILAAIIGGSFAVLATSFHILWELWKLRREDSKKIKLSSFLSVGFELVTVVATKNVYSIPNGLSQREAVLKRIKHTSKIIGVNVPAIINKAISLQKLFESGGILELSEKIQKKYGTKASSAFTMGAFLCVGMLSDGESRSLALGFVERQAKMTGLDDAYITDFLKKVEGISDKLEAAHEINRFFMNTFERFESI